VAHFGDKIVDHHEVEIELPSNNMSDASVLVQQDQTILFVKVNVEQVYNKLSDSNIFKKAFRNLFEGMAPEIVPSVELAKN
jgi:hypothetical protein